MPGSATCSAGHFILFEARDFSPENINVTPVLGFACAVKGFRTESAACAFKYGLESENVKIARCKTKQ